MWTLIDHVCIWFISSVILIICMFSPQVQFLNLLTPCCIKRFIYWVILFVLFGTVDWVDAVICLFIYECICATYFNTSSAVHNNYYCDMTIITMLWFQILVCIYDDESQVEFDLFLLFCVALLYHMTATCYWEQSTCDYLTFQ